MITADAAQHFAEEWIAAWNAHDLPRILSHYADDFSMTSPFIPDLVGEASGTLHGKDAVGAYWGKALSRMPDLRFELLGVFRSMGSVVIHYRNQSGRLAAEVCELNAAGLVQRSVAHYSVWKNDNR